jgi:hypothetical protein
MQDYITMDDGFLSRWTFFVYGFSMGMGLALNAVMGGFIKRCHGSFPSSLEVFSVLWVSDMYQTPRQLAGL